MYHPDPTSWRWPSPKPPITMKKYGAVLLAGLAITLLARSPESPPARPLMTETRDPEEPASTPHTTSLPTVH